MSTSGKVKKVSPSGSQSACYFLEIDLPHREPPGGAPPAYQAGEDQHASYSLNISLCSELTNALSRETIEALLSQMEFQNIQMGEQFLHQGEEADRFYLILKGTCTVHLEKDGVLFTLARLGPGELVGEMAVFTGEKRGANVDAETDMDMLSMRRDQFEILSQQYPEFKRYLSEIVTNRLSSSKITAEKKIGKYLITEKIGDGGSSIIYKGIHNILKLPVAIKMLKHEMAMEPEFIEIFSNEAKIIAQLNHPHIVRVYDIEELYRTVFIVMEYLEGFPLRQLLDSTKTLSLAKTLEIALQVCYGLEYAHSHAIIHQDINPRNIFMQPDGGVKIIDFGLACRRGSVDENFLFPGTIYYISPEQLRGEPVDERTDIYSLGITVYEMLTGGLPVAGDDMKALVNWHMNEDIHDTHGVLTDFPEALHAFFMKSIRKDPAARFSTISEVIELLRPVSETFGVRVASDVFMQQKTIGMFLLYQEQQRLALKRLIEEFSRDVGETGAVLKITPFED